MRIPEVFIEDLGVPLNGLQATSRGGSGLGLDVREFVYGISCFRWVAVAPELVDGILTVHIARLVLADNVRFCYFKGETCGHPECLPCCIWTR